MTDKEIIIDRIRLEDIKNLLYTGQKMAISTKTFETIIEQLQRKEQECEELRKEKEELNDRMAEVIYRATGGRLSYSNYTLNAIEQAFNDQLEILSEQKVEELEKECEELKEEQAKIKKYLGISSKNILERLEELQEFRDRDTEKMFNYKQALEKIDEQIALYQALTISKSRTRRENDCLYKINDIINEVKDV